MNWHIPYLAKMSDQFFSVSIQRDLYDVAQSILFCRERYAGNRNAWWSFKPPQYLDWLDRSPVEQVAAQVVYTQKAVRDNMAAVPHDKKLEVSYAEFCANPKCVYDQIREKYQSYGYEIPANYVGETHFNQKKSIRLNREDERLLREALYRYEAEAVGNIS